MKTTVKNTKKERIVFRFKNQNGLLKKIESKAKMARRIMSRCQYKETEKNIFKEFQSMSWQGKRVVNNLVKSLPVKKPSGRKECERVQSLFGYVKKKISQSITYNYVSENSWDQQMDNAQFENKLAPFSKGNNKVSDSFKTEDTTAKSFEIEYQER